MTITEPGVYDLPEDIYHADPVPVGSLSVTGAKKLLPPSCPAIFRYLRDNPAPSTAAFDFGKAAHMKALGVGAEIVVVDAPDWRTKDAKQARDEIRARGAVPLLPTEALEVDAMAEALKAHPLASALFSDGNPEASLFAPDPETGVMRRGRLDWLPNAADGRLIIPDYKTAQCAEPNAFGRAAASFGYHMQAAWYVDMVTSLGLAEVAAFVFVVQEKTAPYLVSVVELDVLALRIGANRNRQALDIYAKCVADDYWPGYSDDVALVSLPRWAEYEGDVA